MRYLRVKNWEKLQHQSDKPLPWIKFFTALLAPTKEPAYSEWPDATKALLHHVWLMARIFNGRIPEGWLTREKLNLKSRLNLEPLLCSGWIWFEDENGVRLSHSHARVARSGVCILDSPVSPERESEGKPFDAAAEFKALWSRYPRPVGRKAAEKYFASSVKSIDDLRAIQRALDNYLRSSEVARGFVMHGKTWFNNWPDFIEMKEIPHDQKRPEQQPSKRRNPFAIDEQRPETETRKRPQSRTFKPADGIAAMLGTERTDGAVPKLPEPEKKSD